MQETEGETRRLFLFVGALGIVLAGVGAYVLTRPEEIPEGALTDPKQIFAMGKRVFDSGRAGIQACYDARAQEVPTLAGTWRVAFVVSRRGLPTEVRVETQGDSDEALEACIGEVVSGWEFEPLAEPHPMTKVYVLRPPGSAP